MDPDVKEKLRRELHSCTLSLLRQGFTIHAIAQAMIIESHKLADTADVVEAINESNFAP
jgi:hypothetical protein